MSIESPADLKLVPFPAVAIIFFVALGTFPIALAAAHFTTANTGALFAATSIAYFLNYEWFHTFYHLPSDSIVGKIPLVRQLRQHHTRHHDPRFMARANFNITWPICDFLFRTLKK